MGSKEGAAKARAKRDPNMLKVYASKGGKSVKKENRHFYRNRDQAKIAGRKGGEISKRGKSNAI